MTSHRWQRKLRRHTWPSNVVPLNSAVQRPEIDDDVNFGGIGCGDQDKELKDPASDERLKLVINNFFGSGVYRIFKERKNADEAVLKRWSGKNRNYKVWADNLPDHMKRRYGLCSPVSMVRAPRPLNAYTFEMFTSHQATRYMQIAIVAWSNSLPLTRDMHKRLLAGWYQDKYEEVLAVCMEHELIRFVDEDWTDTPKFHGQTVKGMHVRPTRRAIYHSIDSIMFMLDALQGQFTTTRNFFKDYEGKNWVCETEELPELNAHYR